MDCVKACVKSQNNPVTNHTIYIISFCDLQSNLHFKVSDGNLTLANQMDIIADGIWSRKPHYAVSHIVQIFPPKLFCVRTRVWQVGFFNFRSGMDWVLEKIFQVGSGTDWVRIGYGYGYQLLAAWYPDTIHPTQSHPLIAHTATSASDGIFISLAGLRTISFADTLSTGLISFIKQLHGLHPLMTSYVNIYHETLRGT